MSFTDRESSLALPAILFVDDDADELLVAGATMRGLPVRTLFAQSSEEALALVRARTPALLFSEYRRPGIDGIELIRRVRSERPKVTCVLYTADSPVHRWHDIPVLGKPAEASELRSLVLDLATQPDR